MVQYPYYNQSKSTTMTGNTTSNSCTMMEEDDTCLVGESTSMIMRYENENTTNNNNNNNDKEILLTTSSCIEAMMKQEEWYKVQDYLNNTSDNNKAVVVVVDEICREKMYDWCNQTIDFFHLNRHSVHVTMNCLDRFLSSPKGQTYLTSKTLYQLACITCLYICIKTHEPIALSASMIVELCRGTYTIQQIYNTETIILHTLNWYMNPPTHYSYVKRLLYKLNSNSNRQQQEEVAIDDLAKHYCNMVVGDYTLSVHYKPSVVAFGCAMATIKSCSSQQKINTSTNKFVMEHCWHLLSFDDYTKVNEISNALIKATMNGSNNNDVVTAAAATRTTTTTTVVVSTSRKTKSTVAANNKHKNRNNSSSSNNNNKNNISRRYSNNNNVATNTRRVSMNDDDDDDDEDIIKDEDEEAVTKATTTTSTNPTTQQHQIRYLSPVTIVGNTT